MLADKWPPGQPNLFAGRPAPPPRLEEQPAVNFISIESDDPRRDFWVALARLLETLCLAAWTKAVRAR